MRRLRVALGALGAVVGCWAAVTVYRGVSAALMWPDMVPCPLCEEEAHVVGSEWVCAWCGGAGEVAEVREVRPR